MAKNLVSRVVDWGEYEDMLAIESKRAKFQEISKKEKERLSEEEWAFANKVDDAAIISVFGADSPILLLPYRRRARYLAQKALEFHNTTVRTTS